MRVRVLFDESLPRRLARLLEGHQVQTVQAAGWSGIKNGQLLWLALEAGFEAFVTVEPQPGQVRLIR